MNARIKWAVLISVTFMVLLLALFYAEEWVTRKLRPAASRTIVTLSTNAMANMPTNMTPAVRAGIVVALEHIRTEMSHTTNDADLTNLREAEKVLTNVLARP